MFFLSTGWEGALEQLWGQIQGIRRYPQRANRHLAVKKNFLNTVDKTTTGIYNENMSQELVNKAFQPLIDAKSKRKLSVRITDLKEYDETKEGLSFKKIIKSIQSNLPKGTKEVSVEYTNRKGNKIERMVRVPIGRKKKLNR
mgnify:FL=1